MEEERKKPETKVEETKKTGGEPEQENNLPKTQEELDALIKSRLARDRQNRTATPVVTTPNGGQTAQQEGQPPADNPAEDAEKKALQREIVESRAALAAYREGIAPDAVEDAVLLAMHEVESEKEANEEAIKEALKNVLKRHPEWKKEPDTKQTAGFRVGASNAQNNSAEDDRLSSIFGNKKPK